MSVYDNITVEQMHEYIAQFLEVMRIQAEALQGIEIMLKAINEDLDRLEHTVADISDTIKGP